MSAHGRRRYEAGGDFGIPGLGDRNYRPGSSYQRRESQSSETSSVASSLASTTTPASSSSARPATAPAASIVDRRKYVRRSANAGGAADSSQMSSLFCDPPTPINTVKEPTFEEDVVDGGGVTATPFFTRDTGVILIKGGTVVNTDGESTADVLVEDGKIVQVGDEIEIPEDAAVIDASGKIVMPGGIDISTHFNTAVDGKDGLLDDMESGTGAAVAGGTTMIMDLVIPDKEGSLVEAFLAWKENAVESACCDFSVVVAVTSVTDQTLSEMETLATTEGVTLFKVFMSYKDKLMLETADIMKVMKKAKELGCVVLVHAENGDMISENCSSLSAQGVSGPEGHLLAAPEEVELEAVRRICLLALETQAPVLISQPSTSAAVDIIREFREKGAVLLVESSVASLVLDGSHLYNKCYNHAANFVTSPPLRDDEDTKDQLLEAVADGSYELVSSGHCARDKSHVQDSFTLIPQGVVGAEERLCLVYERGVAAGKMQLSQLVSCTSTAAAKLLNVYPRKGCIAEGSDADIVVLDTAVEEIISSKTHHSRAQFNVFEGQTVSVRPEFVITAGKISVAEFQTNPQSGSAAFIAGVPHPPLVYDKISEPAQPRKVERSQVSADSVDGSSNGNSDGFGLTCPRGFRGQQVLNKQLGIYQRPLSAHGIRNQNDSTFSLNG